MGATTFEQIGAGKNAADAFAKALERALYDYGHAGYSGTLAEKNSFVVIESPIEDIHAFIEAVDDYGCSGECKLDKKYEATIIKAHEIYDDKWGPALCVPLNKKNQKGEDLFMFCGWASC